MNPFFVTDFSISDSLKTVRKSVLIYETIIAARAVLEFIRFLKQHSLEKSDSQGRSLEWINSMNKIIKKWHECRYKMENLVSAFFVQWKMERKNRLHR